MELKLSNLLSYWILDVQYPEKGTPAMTRRWPLWIVAFLVLLTMTGCGEKAKDQTAQATFEPSAEGVTCVYESAEGFAFVAAFRDTLAWVFLPEGTRALPRVPSASGARFNDGEVNLWTKGQDAILSRPGLGDQVFVNNPRQAVWEHAKLSGVDFRAVGNEPGWVLEIWGDGRILYTGDYGQTVLEFPRPEPTITQEPPRSTYTCRQGDHTLIITLEPGPCRDTMADEEFETRVTLQLDEKLLHGCGRPLH